MKVEVRWIKIHTMYNRCVVKQQKKLLGFTYWRTVYTGRAYSNFDMARMTDDKYYECMVSTLNNYSRLLKVQEKHSTISKEI